MTATTQEGITTMSTNDGLAPRYRAATIAAEATAGARDTLPVEGGAS